MPITSRRIFTPSPSASTSKKPTGAGGKQDLFTRLGAFYRSRLPSHPFLLFGLPFITIILTSSFLLTPATALRFERHDRKNRQVTQEEKLKIGVTRDGQRRERTAGKFESFVIDRGDGDHGGGEGDAAATAAGLGRKAREVGSAKEEYYRLMAKDLDNWEQKRVQRWKGEPDGRL